MISPAGAFEPNEWAYRALGDFGDITIIVDEDGMIRRVRLWVTYPGRYSTLYGEVCLSSPVPCPTGDAGCALIYKELSEAFS